MCGDAGPLHSHTSNASSFTRPFSCSYACSCCVCARARVCVLQACICIMAAAPRWVTSCMSAAARHGPTSWCPVMAELQARVCTLTCFGAQIGCQLRITLYSSNLEGAALSHPTCTCTHLAFNYNQFQHRFVFVRKGHQVQMMFATVK